MARAVSTGRGRPISRGPEVKIYLVMVPVPFPEKGRPNVRVVCSKLSRATAEAVQVLVPNSYIIRQVADKQVPDMKTITRKL